VAHLVKQQEHLRLPRLRLESSDPQARRLGYADAHEEWAVAVDERLFEEAVSSIGCAVVVDVVSARHPNPDDALTERAFAKSRR